MLVDVVSNGWSGDVYACTCAVSRGFGGVDEYVANDGGDVSGRLCVGTAAFDVNSGSDCA